MVTDTELTISVVPETLTDNSVVFNVVVGEVTLPARTEADACALAEAIVDAINLRTTAVAEVHYG
jgi:hypothetical protein